MASQRPRYHLIDLLMVVILCGLIAGAAREVVRLFEGQAQGDLTFEIFGFWAAFVIWGIVWTLVRTRRNAPTCPDCGRRFVPPKKGDPCPWCRHRSQSPAQFKQEYAKNMRALGLCLVGVAFCMGLFLSDMVGERFGRAFWIALPLVSIAATLALAAGFVVVVVVLVTIKAWLTRDERFAIARARKVAGKEGEVVKDGAITVWYSGPNDPTPMLMEQMDVVRRRFETLIGAEIEPRPPLCILVFDRRADFVAYHRRTFADLWNLDALYASAPWRTVSLSVQTVPYRLTNPERTARVVFGFHRLESSQGFFSRSWLQQGIAQTLAYGGDRDELARLNRRMVVSITKGVALDAELFHLSAGALLRLIQKWYVHDRFSRFAQLHAQSWSLVEYLAGSDAPEERRRRFRSFVGDLRRGKSDDTVFERHFGYGFAGLLKDWREWVLGRGLGLHALAASHVREDLTTRIIPIVRDPRAKLMDRIQAVRDMGRAGYALGVATLIDLVREPGEIPKEEIVWALEAISGLALADDRIGWQSWLSGLPREVVCETDDDLEFLEVDEADQGAECGRGTS